LDGPGLNCRGLGYGHVADLNSAVMNLQLPWKSGISFTKKCTDIWVTL